MGKNNEQSGNKRLRVNTKANKQKSKILNQQGVEELNSIKKWFSSLFGRRPKSNSRAKLVPTKEQRQTVNPNVNRRKTSAPTQNPTQNPTQTIVREREAPFNRGKLKKGSGGNFKGSKGNLKSRLSKDVEAQIALAEKEHSKDKEGITAKPKDTNRGFSYTKPITNHEIKSNKVSEVIDVTDEKIVKRSVVLSTVKDINDVSLVQRVGLVNYFNAVESGKLDERAAKEEYKRNTEILKKENSLKSMLIEIGNRNLVYGEYPDITVLVEPTMRKELEECMKSKLLSSFEFEIVKKDDILIQMNVDPIVLKMKLKVVM